MSNKLVSCCQKVLFHFWYFSINLFLLQSWCWWLSGPHGLSWQSYLFSGGWDRSVSHSHDVPALGCVSPRKHEYISFRETVCNLVWQHSPQNTLQSIPQAVFSVSSIHSLYRINTLPLVSGSFVVEALDHSFYLIYLLIYFEIQWNSRSLSDTKWSYTWKQQIYITGMTTRCLLKTFPKLSLYPDMNSSLQSS